MFSKLSRTNSSHNFSQRSYTSNKNSANIRQEECQYNDIPEMANFEEQLANWHLPKVKPSDIYSIGMLDFKMAMTIKTIEQTIPVNRDMETIQLLHKEELRRYFDKYKYVHLGMVQVAVKPLTAQGLNTSVLIVLRDCRHLEFKDSLLGIIQTSLCNGPVYFNCFSNFSVSLTDKNILDVLTLNIKTHGYKLKEGTEPLNITYRVHYKAMTTLSPRAKTFDTKRKTVLIETNLLKSDVQTPQTIKWDDIEPPTEWNLLSASPAEPVENKNIEEIIQTKEGHVFVKFDKGKRLPARSSFSDYENTFRQGSQSSRFYTPNPSLASFKTSNLTFDGVVNTPQGIPRAIYHEEKNEPETLSEFDNISTINMLSIPFSYDSQTCVNDMNQEKYTSFKNWFFSTYTKEKQQIYKTLFYKHIDHIQQLGFRV